MINKIGVVLVLVTYISVTSAWPPCICTREWRPVCGSDGQTYSTQCMLECARESNPSLQLVSLGQCRAVQAVVDKDPCVCTDDLNPVCASDGKSYENECVMKCQDHTLNVNYKGKCREKRQVPCICPLNYDPVCSSNGHTYPNECSMKCEDGELQVLHKGNCRETREACDCPFDYYSPVCSWDGRIYRNLCFYNCSGPPEQFKLLFYYCPSYNETVCGTDGNTYGNMCDLYCGRKNVVFAHRGECRNKREVVDVPCICTRELKPVCASNGVTYNNECMMRCAGADLSVNKDGPCDL